MNVLIVLGHPRTDSFCAALAESYREGALEAGVNVRELALAHLEFDPDVHEDCPSEQELEDDLVAAQEHIRWADHLVFVYPNWWGTMPALLKGFFDRVFHPGFAFSVYEEGEGSGHEELLSAKTAELLVTMDVPPWVYRFIYRQPGNNAVKRATLGYAGVRTTRVTNLGSVEESSPEEREEWLEEATRLGRSLESGPEPRSARIRRSVTAWLKALRLQFYPMSLMAYAVGALAAVGSSVAFDSRTFWLGALFLFFLEATAVLGNEYVDYRTDRENAFSGPFTGGSRVLVDGDLDFADLRYAIAITLALTVAFGAGVLSSVLASDPGPLVSTVLPAAAVMGVLAVLALGYTIPPLKLSYRTLGELDVAVTHSIGVLLCGFVFLGGRWYDPLPWLLSLPFLLSIVPSITLAGIPDYAADRSAGKRTLAVRFGIDSAVRVAQGTTILAAVVAVCWQRFGVVAAYGPLVYLAVVHALILVWLLRARLGDIDGPRRIDGVMAVALGYPFWFAVVPLIGLV